jgi:hypothetical protein
MSQHLVKNLSQSVWYFASWNNLFIVIFYYYLLNKENRTDFGHLIWSAYNGMHGETCDHVHMESNDSSSTRKQLVHVLFYFWLK